MPARNTDDQYSLEEEEGDDNKYEASNESLAHSVLSLSHFEPLKQPALSKRKQKEYKEMVVDRLYLRFELEKAVAELRSVNKPLISKTYASIEGKRAMHRVHHALKYEIIRLCSFYSHEEIMLLSLAFDAISRLQDLQMDNLEMVMELFEITRLVSARVTGLSAYLTLTIGDFHGFISEAEEALPGYSSSSTNRAFLKISLSDRENSLRRLVEMEGLFKAYASLLFIKAKMDPEVKKLSIYRPCHLNFHESSRQQRRISFVMEECKQLQTWLESQEDFFLQDHTQYWKGLGLRLKDVGRAGSLLNRVEEFYENRSYSKDDFIAAPADPLDRDMQDYEEVEDKASPDLLSLWMVLLHITFYMTNYYGLYVTSYEKMKKLGSSPSEYASFVAAITPVSASILIFLYDRCLTFEIKTVYFMSYCYLIAGNLCYFFSTLPSTNSFILLFIGRVLIGAGGIGIVTKRYMAVMINDKYRDLYSTITLLLANIGKSLGPGAAGLIRLVRDKQPDKSVWHDLLVFSLFCAIMWVGLFILWAILFRSQARLMTRRTLRMKKLAKVEAHYYAHLMGMPKNEIQHLVELSRKRNNELEEGGKTPLRKQSAMPPVHASHALNDENLIRHNPFPTPTKQPPAYSSKLVSGFILGMLIFSMASLEALYTEFPIVAIRPNWFSLTLPQVGLGYFSTIIIILPVSLLARPIVRTVEDRKIIFLCLALLFIGLFIHIDLRYVTPNSTNHISIYQYAVGSSFILFGSILCEDAATHILSKVSAPVSQLGHLNAGIASGYGSALGRALGNLLTGLSALTTGQDFMSVTLYTALCVLAVVLALGLSLLYRRMTKLVFAQRIINEDLRAPSAELQTRPPATFRPIKIRGVSFPELPR